MNQIRLSSLLQKGIIILEIILLVYFLVWHFKLGLNRYFDIDEYAHLHWGYSLFIKERPYTDFFYHFPPFFLYPVASAFLLFGRGIASVIAVRILIFSVFLAVCLLLFLIVKKLRNFQTALLAVVIFTFLPLPFDKTIEVRPDLFALFFALVGFYLFILGRKRNKKKLLFLSGLFYSFSLGFVPKSVFFLMPAVAVLIFQAGKAGHRRIVNGEIISFFMGILTTGLILTMLIFSFGNFGLSIYSIFKLTQDMHSSWAANFFIPANFSFYPNDVYYGIAGFSLPFFANLAIYLTASIWAISRFISLRNNIFQSNEFVWITSFWGSFGAFVYLYPMKHPQHLIFVAPFIAFYFADLMISLPLLRGLDLPKGSNSLKGGCIFFLMLIFLGLTGKQMNEEKLQWKNLSTLDKINTFLTEIPKDEPVFDLTGKTIFFPNGYYVCCQPYGQFIDAVSIKIPNIENDLRKRGTKYVHTEQYERIYALPPMEARYIEDNFEPYFPDGSLLIRSDNKKQRTDEI